MCYIVFTYRNIKLVHLTPPSPLDSKYYSFSLIICMYINDKEYFGSFQEVGDKKKTYYIPMLTGTHMTFQVLQGYTSIYWCLEGDIADQSG